MVAWFRMKIAAAPGPASIIIMLLSMFLFTSNDAVGKWLTGSYSVGQLVFIRSLVALITLLPFLWRSGAAGVFRLERSGVFWLRVILTVADSFSFYFAVSYLPLADVMTYWLAAPIYVAALSPILLGEKVGWRRWSAIGIGFLGVIIALEPSRDMLSPAAIASLVGSLSFGLVMLTARSLRTTSGLTMIIWQTAGGLLAGLVTLPLSWTTPPPEHWTALVLLGLLAMVAHVFVNWAFKLADAATVAPLQYTQLLWAILFGWMFFGDFPSPAKFIGAGLIVASGLFIFFRERQVRQRKMEKG